MSKREENFFSAIIYADGIIPETKVKALDNALLSRFENSEIICCFDGNANDKKQDLEQLFGSLACPAVTIIYMGKSQGLEAAMNSGIDAAVGDYVLEIDSLDSFDVSFINNAYEKCMEGFDIVIGETSKPTRQGRLFYPLFNRFSGSPYALSSSSCSLVSRRAINRIRSLSAYAPYRKAAYAASGLLIAGIPAGPISRSPKRSNLNLAMDALAIYSDAFYKISFGFSAIMIAISLIELIYIIVIYAMGLPIGGWTTTMLAITFGFLGVFVSLTFILKYVALLVRLQMGKNTYLVEGVEKIGNTSSLPNDDI